MKKKLVLILSVVTLMLAYNMLVYAEDNSYNDISYKEFDEAMLRADIWGIINTTRGNIMIPTTARVPGTTSYYIKLLQCCLNTLGYNSGTADGIYGNNTRNAIMAFQVDQKIDSDGIAGRSTWLRISNSLSGITVTF